MKWTRGNRNKNFTKGQKESPFSASVKKVAEDLFPFWLMVKNKHFKELKDMERFLINASHASSHLFLRKVVRTPTLTFLWGVGTHVLCPVMPLLVK